MWVQRSFSTTGQLDFIKLLPQPVLLSYDITFQLGHLYISAFLFRHVLFQSSPVIPAAFLIHERKYQSAHEIMMSHMKTQLPSLQKLQSPIPIVVDSKTALGKAIENNFPGVKVVKCWNHVINAAKRWLQDHLKGTSENPKSLEISVYVCHLRDLFHQPNEESYRSKLDSLMSYWSVPFREYYNQYIDPQVRVLILVHFLLYHT